MKTMFYLAAGLGVLFASEAVAESAEAQPDVGACMVCKRQVQTQANVKGGPGGMPGSPLAVVKGQGQPEVKGQDQKIDTSVKFKSSQTLKGGKLKTSSVARSQENR